jgi:hypothetical protein
LAEDVENCSNSAMGGVWGGGSLPSANPDNVAAGGVTDARCGGEGGEEG